MKRWEFLYKPDLKNHTLTPQDIVSVILLNRGITSEDEIKEFLFPDPEKVTLEAVGIKKTAVKKALIRILQAKKADKTIVIYGDYDVDGICATAILWEAIYSDYKKVIPYIPHRADEGYGLSIKGIDHVLKKYPDTDLIITVDNGIVAYEALEYAKNKKIDVVVTDHHVKEEKKKLSAYVIVHTTKLCGTSIAYLLAKEYLGEQYEDGQFLDLVSLATVADLVPLTESNRTLLALGLKKLRKTQRYGLQALFQEAGIDSSKIGVYEIGHIIAPRMNATGRLSSALDSLRLICTKDSLRAQKLAGILSQSNKDRQFMTKDLADHAVALSAKECQDKRIIVIAHESYNQGVVGLIASRLVETYYKPALVISMQDGHSKGSARSIKGINIIEMIRSVSDYVVQAGGHPMAAGFTVETHRIADLRKALEERAEALITDDHLQRFLNIDIELPWEMINYGLYKEIQKLSPFGMGNPEPVFSTSEVSIRLIKTMGKDNKHYRMMLEKDGKTIEAVAFNFVDSLKLHINDTIDIAYTIGFDTWNGNNKIVLYIKDIKIPAEDSQYHS